MVTRAVQRLDRLAHVDLGLPETAKLVSQMISPSRNSPSEPSTSSVTSGEARCDI
jgi:hypothetical protein